MIGRYRCREPENFRASIRSSDLVQIEANIGAIFLDSAVQPHPRRAISEMSWQPS